MHERLTGADSVNAGDTRGQLGNFCHPNSNVVAYRSLVDRRSWASYLAYPKILAWRPLCWGPRHIVLYVGLDLPVAKRGAIEMRPSLNHFHLLMLFIYFLYLLNNYAVSYKV